jgi:hypothetical protein
MLNDVFMRGSCSRLRSSESIVFALAEAWRIARVRLPVSAPSGADKEKSCNGNLDPRHG